MVVEDTLGVGDPRPAIVYRLMARDENVTLVEFREFTMYMNALSLLMKAYPVTKFLTGVGEEAIHQIVLQTKEQVTYLKLIESDIKNANGIL